MATSSNLVIEGLRISLQNAQQRRASVLDEKEALEEERARVNAEFDTRVSKLNQDLTNIESEISQTQTVLDILQAQMPSITSEPTPEQPSEN
jgi:chromosome segregation ATPase